MHARFSVAVKDHGIPLIKYPKVSSANGLTILAKNVFNWNGHHLERVNSTGRPIDRRKEYVNVLSQRKIAGSIDWIPGTGDTGTADCHGHFHSPEHKFAIPIRIEIKYGKDRQREEQKKYEAKMHATKAIYTIVSFPEDVFEFYDYLNTL